MLISRPPKSGLWIVEDSKPDPINSIFHCKTDPKRSKRWRWELWSRRCAGEEFKSRSRASSTAHSLRTMEMGFRVHASRSSIAISNANKLSLFFFFFLFPESSSVWLPRQFGKNKRKLNLEFPLFIWILFYIVLGYRKNIIGEKAAPHQRTMGLRFCYCRPFGCWENVGKRSELKHGDLLFFLLVFS